MLCKCHQSSPKSLPRYLSTYLKMNQYCVKLHSAYNLVSTKTNTIAHQNIMKILLSVLLVCFLINFCQGGTVIKTDFQTTHP